MRPTSRCDKGRQTSAESSVRLRRWSQGWCLQCPLPSHGWRRGMRPRRAGGECLLSEASSARLRRWSQGWDITDSKRLEAELREHAKKVEELATHDALTGIENRRAFVAGLERALALCRRGTCSMVLFMDVDEFKRCNDERGHAFGDEILVSVAGLLKKGAREVDLVARVGGDEFAAVLADATEDGASEVW